MRVKLGDVVELKFLDHSATAGGGNAQPVVCSALGRIKHIDKVYIRLVTWEVEGEEEIETTPNREGFAVLRSAILKTKRFK